MLLNWCSFDDKILSTLHITKCIGNVTNCSNSEMMFADTFWTLQKILTGVYCVNMTDDPQDKRRISGMKISCIDYVIN